jgi:hypothetical protein
MIPADFQLRSQRAADDDSLIDHLAKFKGVDF